jgi:hypothetical protein
VVALNLARDALVAGHEAEAVLVLAHERRQTGAACTLVGPPGYLGGDVTPVEAALFLGVAELAAGKSSGGQRLEKALKDQGRRQATVLADGFASQVLIIARLILSRSPMSLCASQQTCSRRTKPKALGRRRARVASRN